MQGYYRRACALMGLGLCYDALAALLHCVNAERILLPQIHNKMTKVNFIYFNEFKYKLLFD